MSLVVANEQDKSPNFKILMVNTMKNCSLMEYSFGKIVWRKD